MKKIKFLCALLPIFFMLGCQNDNITISDLHEINISSVLESYVSCINAYNLYQIEEYTISVEVLKEYGIPAGYDGENVYFLRGNLTENDILDPSTELYTAMIAIYNLESKEITELLEEQNMESHIGYVFAGIYGSHLYYYREYMNSISLYRLNLSDKTTEILFTFASENTVFPNLPIRFEDSLFFDDFSNINFETREYDSSIYRCNIDTGSITVFKENAERPTVYKNTLIFYQNGAFYYDQDNGDNETLLFCPNTEGNEPISVFHADGETVMYAYYNYDEYGSAYSSTFGIYNDNFEREDIAETAYAHYIDSFIALNGSIVFGGYTTQPVIYNTEYGLFASIDTEREIFYSLASEDKFLFFGYNVEWDIVNGFIKDVVIYVVS